MHRSRNKQAGGICSDISYRDDSELSNLTMDTRISEPEENEKPREPLEACPKCGFEQVFNNECRQCGIVFEKFYRNQPEPAPDPEIKEPPLSEEMEKAVAQAKMIGMMSAIGDRKRYHLRKILKLGRIGLLFSVLAVVALYTTCTDMRMAGWKNTLDVVVYPINGDQTDSTHEYIDMLDADNFISIEDFMMSEADSYDLQLEKPVTVHLAPEIGALPPEPPVNQSALVVAWWSLKMRYWAFKHNTYKGSSDIRIYVIYKAPENMSTSIEVSVGIRKGFIGIVNTNAGDPHQDYTNIVITHELLHTLGAKDKYDYNTFMPIHPGGYADPERDPLYPQVFGEIMAVRIPKTAQTFYMPKRLKDLIIGEDTCAEIQWCKTEDI